MQNRHATIIALDWGTSNLRAFLLDAAGRVLDSREKPWGILSLPPVPADADAKAGFDAALAGIAGDWIAAHPQARLIASGMVGSAQGWREAPYVRCPVDLDALARHTVRVTTELGPTLILVPGLLQNDPSDLPDVMRGEETQVFGAAVDGRLADGCYVLPGTHSKWTRVVDGRVQDFATYMTGETYAVLCKHSILGRLMEPPDASAPAAFAQGLATARASGPGDLMRHLFTVRSMKLAGRMHAGALADYLSGLLIGHELVSASHHYTQDGQRPPIVLIGEPALRARYVQAFAAFHWPVRTLDNTAAIGLARIAGALADTEPATSH